MNGPVQRVRVNDAKKQGPGRVCVLCGKAFADQDAFHRHSCAADNGLRSLIATGNEPVSLAMVGRMVYNHNPFYLVSVALVLTGLNRSFQASDIWVDTWVPMGILLAYTVLMGATAVAIVRFGEVWEDARSILLCLAGLLLCLSVGMDEILMRDGGWPVLASMVAAGIGIGLCEGLRRGVGIRLPWRWLAPWYGMLALLFIYPAVPAMLSLADWQAAVRWSLVGFPVAAGAMVLGLLPAVRRGETYGRDNGSPWPLLPWMVSAAAVAGALAKTYLLTLSFYPGRGEGGFGSLSSPWAPWLVAPIAVAVAVVLMEAGRAWRREALAWTGSAVLLGTGLLAWITGSDAARDLAVDTVGDAPLVVAWMVTGVFAVAWLRTVRGAQLGTAAALLLAAGRAFRGVSGESPAWTVGGVGAVSEAAVLLPVAGLAVLAGMLAWRSRAAFWALLSGWCVVIGFAVGLRDTGFTAMHGAVPWHLGLVTALAVGLACDDDVARWIRRGCAGLVVALAAGALLAPNVSSGVSWGAVTGYCFGLMAAAAVAWVARPHWYFLAAAGGVLVLGTLRGGLGLWSAAETLRFRGEGPFLWGMGCFAMAVLISSIKGRIWQRLAAAARRWNQGAAAL